MTSVRPKIGIALSGASGRAITHIGVLEALRENNIPIDFITACSSGTLIASAYACGTMEQLKKDWLRLNKKFLMEMFALDKTGQAILRTEKLAKWIGTYTQGKSFEDVRPALGFVCADIISGKPVTLSLGDLVHAGKASCAVPGLFEPVEWGNRLLVDGGLFSIVPTEQAREMGADIVIGVDVASSRYIFDKEILRIRKSYNFLKRSFPVRLYTSIHALLDKFFTKSIDFIYYNQSDILEESVETKPNMFTTLGRALDIAVAEYGKQNRDVVSCEYLISPEVKHLGKIDFENSQLMLDEGKRACVAAIPDIQRIIRDFSWRHTPGLFKRPKPRPSPVIIRSDE